MVVNVVETILRNSQVQITPPHLLQLVITEDEQSSTLVCVLEQLTSTLSLISAGGVEHSPVIATIYNK